VSKRLHKKPITDGQCRQWREKLREVLEIDGWKVRNTTGSVIVIVERAGFQTTIRISGVSGCVCGNVRFAVNMFMARVRSRFVDPRGEHVEITVAPTEDALALPYVAHVLNATAKSESPARCSTVPPTMEVRYQYTAAAWETCPDCFKRKQSRT
jgi:hypothetical protein